MSSTKTHPVMADVIRTYFDGCNEADVEKMVACMEPDAVHYFPPGMYGGPFKGARVIAERWRAAVEKFGSYWTVDWIVCDAKTGKAAIEWTHFKTKNQVLLRGAETYAFDERSGLITEIRAYYASPQDPELKALELDGFDYQRRGYALGPPPGEREDRPDPAKDSE